MEYNTTDNAEGGAHALLDFAAIAIPTGGTDETRTIMSSKYHSS
jgi:hypothetical protein